MIDLELSTHIFLIRQILEDERRRRCWALRNLPHRKEQKVEQINTALKSLDALEAHCCPKEYRRPALIGDQHDDLVEA